MADLPLTWEELRRRSADEATAEVPDELREDWPAEPPQKEIHFVDRAAADEPEAKAEQNDGYRPPWLASSFLPRRLPLPKPPTVSHHGQELKPLFIWFPDDRAIYNDLSYPWGCVCKITNAAGRAGSGVLIGPRHVLTASHCVAWNTTDAELIQVHLTGTTAAASAFDTVAYAYTQISGDPGASQLDEDYAVLVTEERLGDRFGWLGRGPTTATGMTTASGGPSGIRATSRASARVGIRCFSVARASTRMSSTWARGGR